MTLDEQLELKIKLEKIFRREVRSLFNRIRIEYRIAISTGTTLRASKYAPQWVALLQKHYTRVQKAFNGVVKDSTKQSEQDDEVSAALLLWAELNSKESGGEIINTTQNNMDDAITQARQSFSDEGNYSYTTRELAVLSAVMLDRKFKGREETIAITETQGAAESTKLIEAYSIAGLSPVAVVTREPVRKTEDTKKWFDDNGPNVRDGHHAYQVAVVKINDPFIVNGERLMYPRDMSMGASIANIVNCHCSAEYTFN